MSVGSWVFVHGWRLSARLPEVVVRAAMLVAADVACLRRGGGVQRLEANLRRARPTADDAELRRLVRANMRAYLRYYGETFALARLTPDQLLARVRVTGAEELRAEFAAGHSAVLALGHQGNWDMAGAWATVHIAPVTTVAERLEPPEVFEEFLRLREGGGMTILPLDPGQDLFRDLLRAVRSGTALVPLLADRDLTSRGVEVDLLGERARVAVGPAALAVSANVPLYATTIRHERLTGERRRRAGSPWGIALGFEKTPDPGGATRSERVKALTQAWVDQLGADIAAHPEHWHMLQRVFVADLDPAKAPGAGSDPAPTANRAAGRP